jgi:short-subunit dehydrogenase
VERFAFEGGTAVVTGAASGIGEAVATALAARGSNLVLLDVVGDRLAAVAASIRSRHAGVAVDEQVVDLADPVATDAACAAILARHPRIRLLVNNAGVALGGRFEEVTLDEFGWVIDVNFLATVRMTHTLLPALRAEPGSHLVNLSSLFGLIAPGGQTAYSASKFAVRGFSEALRQELAPAGIGVTCVHPGGVRTRIAESARVGSGVPAGYAEQHKDDWKSVLTMDPADAAAIIVDGIERRRPRVLITRTAKVLDGLARLMPVGYASLLAVAARRRSRTADSTPAVAPSTASSTVD